MSSQEKKHILNLSALSANLLAEQEVVPRARAFARFVVEWLPESAVSVYTLMSDPEGNYWKPRSTVGEGTVHGQRIRGDSGLLGQLMENVAPLLRSGAAVKREDYPHIDIRKTLLSLCYVPLVNGENLVGALEIISFEKELTKDEVIGLEQAARVGAVALASGQAYEEERNGTFTSISRLTQLYDLEKVFSSTLEMEELLPLIGSRFSELLEAQTVNIWLLHPDETIELIHQNGKDPTSFKGQMLQPNEGVAGTISDNGESVCISDPEDPRLVERNAAGGDSSARSILAAPIMDRGALIGVVEVVNKLNGIPFDEDDLFLLTSLNDTASTALHNASLMAAERKVEILETLNTVSHEITSTLNLERMLQTIVNAPQAVIPYERAAIMLEKRGRFKLNAVTGLTQVNVDAPEIASLHEILQWACLSNEVIHVRQHDEEIDADREETRAKFKKYFADSRMRGFYARPLSDDTGRVGLLAMESSDPDFLGPAHVEIVEVLAGQATVALRNAQLYKEVPFISVLEPVLDRKRKFMAMDKFRRRAILGVSAAVVIFLAICPLPMRVDGDAVVTPLSRVQVQPEFEAVVGKVYVHEGEAVTRGQVLAEMEAWNYRSALAGSEARYQTALLQMNRALMANDGSEAGLRRVDADYWKAEVGRARELLAKAQLRAPIDGVVATPHVENLAGRRLQYGESFAEVVDTSSVVVDVAIDDSEASLLKEGSRAVVKLNSYPLRTFRGNVVLISPKGQQEGESRVFFARVLVPNPDGAIRTGMQGRGKVSVGRHTAGYVLFRRPVQWLYSRMWAWTGW
ncbi:MAG TPA: GAF domain-containing protein [Candidatus Acidoferrum sp.]